MTMSVDTPARRVTLADTGEEFTCLAGESVLRGLARLGRRGIPIGCRGGGCGVCKVEVLAGGFDKQQMSRAHVSEADESEGRVLACRICPRDSLVVKVVGRLNKAVCRGAERAPD